MNALNDLRRMLSPGQQMLTGKVTVVGDTRVTIEVQDGQEITAIGTNLSVGQTVLVHRASQSAPAIATAATASVSTDPLPVVVFFV